MLDILTQLGPVAIAIVFLAAAAESAAFVGLAVPGELLVILGGVLAGVGQVPLWLAVVAAVTGAIAGDGVGYWMGARYGSRLLDRPRLVRHRPRVARASAFLERNGWWALVVARFAAMLRALVPFVAGMMRMRWTRFAFGNAIGGILWGVAITGIGYLAGRRWETIEALIRKSGLVIAAIGLVLGAAVVAGRWVARHPYRVHRRLARIARIPVIGRLMRLTVTAWGRPRPFVRLVPHLIFLAGLITMASAAAMVDWSFAEKRIIEWLAARRTPALADAAGAMAALVTPGRVAIGALLVSLVSLADRRPRIGLLVGGAFLLQFGILQLLNRLVHRPVGPIPIELVLDSPFPAPGVAVATTLVLGVAWPWSRGWRSGVWRVTAGVVVVILVAAVITAGGAAYPVDAAAAVTMGAAAVLAAGIVADTRLRRLIATVPQGPSEPSRAMPLRSVASAPPQPHRS